MGTETGNSKAKGHKASKTKAPRALFSNQRARKSLQRCNTPIFSSREALKAPNQAPALFNEKSTTEGTRDGRYDCKVSKPSDSKAAAPAARLTACAARPLRSADNESKKPKGA